MNDYNKLLSFFSKYLIDINISEDDQQLTVIATTSSLNSLDSEALKNELSKFPGRDTVILYIQINDGDAIVLSSKNITSFPNVIQEIQDQLVITDKEINVKIKVVIEKSKKNNCISIYSLNNFSSYLEKLELEGLLFVFDRLTSKDERIIFECLDNIECFYTKRYAFKYFGDSTNFNEFISSQNRREILAVRNSQTHFSNSALYDFIPEDFYIFNKSKVFERINQIFDKLCIIHSIIAFFDYSKIDKNLLYSKLNGYKTFDFVTPFSEITPTNLDTYFRLYNWIYVGGNFSDKIGLARNILSLHLKKDINKIKGDVNTAVFSSFEIYLKKNVEQYILVKNKVAEFLNSLNEKATSIVDNFSTSFRNSIFAFLSFFTSVFIIRFLSKGNINEIITTDIFWLTQGFLAISLVYLFIATWEINKNKERFIRNYNNNKLRYNELLDETDIANIFNNDEDFDYDLDFIKKRIKAYFFLWLFAIITFSIIITYLAFCIGNR